MLRGKKFAVVCEHRGNAGLRDLQNVFRSDGEQIRLVRRHGTQSHRIECIA